MVLPTYLGRGVLLKNNFSAKYDNSYFFCSRYFRFLVFARQPAKYTVENRYKPTRRRFVPEKMTKWHKLIQLGSKPVMSGSVRTSQYAPNGVLQCNLASSLWREIGSLGLIFQRYRTSLETRSSTWRRNASVRLSWALATGDMGEYSLFLWLSPWSLVFFFLFLLHALVQPWC